MAEMFTNAAAYERLMGRWSARLAPLFVDFAQIRDGAKVLDIGCGTGSLVHAVAAVAGRSTIVGIDRVPLFIEYCRKRFGDPRISFERGDALELPCSNGTFDQVLSLLVLTFIPEPERAVREMCRVTRPGGTVAACTWDRDGLEMTAVLWEEALRLDPEAEVRGERPQHCDRQGALVALWLAAGLVGVEETALEIRTDFSCFEDYWVAFANGVGPPGVYIAGLSAEHRNTLRHALRQRLLAGGADGPFALGARAWAVRGFVPS